MEANDFLTTAKTYADKATADEATLLESVASHLIKNNKCDVLVWLMVLTADPLRVTPTNRFGYTMWLIEEYNAISSQFGLREQNSVNERTVHLSMHQLCETAVLTTYRLRVLCTDFRKLALTDTTTPTFTHPTRLRGLQFETVDKEGRLVYAIRSVRKANTIICHFTVKNGKKATKAASSSSVSGASRTVAPVAF
jgi:hypothetical protein